MSEYIDELRAMWDSALSEAVRNRANKNAAENGDGAKYSLRSYSEQQLRNWENSKRIAVYSSEAQLREFIKDARAGRIGGRKMYFGMVPQNLAQKIMSETGINVDGYNCSLSAYEIQKIFKDHGNAATERLRGQRAVTEDDVAAIPEILQDADTIVLSDKKYNGKPAIQFTKNGNGRVNLVAVVSDKHLDLFVQTMYAGIKKGNLATPTGEQAPINTPEASRSTVSNNRIRSSSENSNTKIKKSERDVDLTAKYPQLNLNEDISELDGVPAIELTDGSVLPITERDGRYPTHVSFIEANRIDVDDLKSGGWIGNGVYDPSFTSDTQRYIERQQARKHVAELTGKQYEQFRYSMRDVTTGDTREELAQCRAA